MSNREGEIYTTLDGDNAWKVIEDNDSQLKLRCVQGSKKGNTDTISAVDLSGMIKPDDLK